MYKSIVNDLKIFAKHLTVLIAEDEKSLGEELRDLLELFFYKVYYAKDGELALNIYKKYKCDIVMTDLKMPKMNGLQLSREIRTLDKNQVIMVLSGYIDDYVVDLIDIGIQTLIIKPYDSTNFLQKITVQCENILLRKEFERVKLERILEKNIEKKDKPKKVKSAQIDEAIDEIIESKNTNEIIDNYIHTFSIADNKKVDSLMWKHISEDILELNSDYEDVINLMTLNGYNEEINFELVRIFHKYHTSLLLLPGMGKMAIMFKDLSDTLEDLNLENYTSDSLEVFYILEYFYEDIIKFFNIIFIEKDTRNTDYLADSMISSVMQLKSKLGLIELEDEELELF